jgi:hypothetical protein
MPTMNDPVAEAVGRGDLDELVRFVDGLCSSREWTEVIRLRDRCRHALERGLQLWPAAEYAEYRLALHAPAEHAGPVVREGAGRFALGPLWEVAASTHDWAELSAHIPDGPARSMAAHERVVRGEDLSTDSGIDTLILEMPLRLEPWEPHYPPAVYRSDTADFPTPPAPALAPVDLPEPGPDIDDEQSHEALYDLGKVWSEQSNGLCLAVAVEGTAEAAIAACGHRRARAADVELDAVLAWMTWAGASGGAYGRRRGTPAGRFAAWWALGALADVEWPPDPEELHAAADRLRWVMWEPADLAGGWSLHLAAEEPGEGIAWAVAATDAYREDDPLAP